MNGRKFLKTGDCPMCGGDGKRQVIDGDALRKVRKDAGVSLRSMAKRIGISPAYLSDIELGKRQGSKMIVLAYTKL